MDDLTYLLANGGAAIVKGASLGVLMFSFALSAVLILFVTMLFARHEAELGAPLVIITSFLLMAVEFGINFYWTVTWEGSPGRIPLLLSVFLPVGAVGVFLLEKLHYTSWAKSAAIMSIYCTTKIAFAIFVGVALTGKINAYGPTPITVWLKGEDWGKREVAHLRMELPAEMNAYIGPVPKEIREKLELHESGQIIFGDYAVMLLMGSSKEGDFDLDGAVKGMINSVSQPGVDNIESSHIDIEVDGYPGRRVKVEIVAEGESFLVDAVILAVGQTGWTVQLGGEASAVLEHGPRILESIEFVNPAKPVPDSVKLPKLSTKDKEDGDADKPSRSPSGNKPKSNRRSPYTHHTPGKTRPVTVDWVEVIADPIPEPYPMLMSVLPKYRSQRVYDYFRYDVQGRTEHYVLAYSLFKKEMHPLRIDGLEFEQKEFFQSLPITHKAKEGVEVPGVAAKKPIPKSPLFDQFDKKPAASPKYPIKRVLKSPDGKEVSATIIGRSGSVLIFTNEDGKLFRYPINKLSTDDRGFVHGLPITEQ